MVSDGDSELGAIDDGQFCKYECSGHVTVSAAQLL